MSNEPEPIRGPQACREALEKGYEEAKSEIMKLAAELAESRDHAKQAADSAARMAEKEELAKTELAKTLARHSKDKEGLVHQVDAMRTRVKNMGSSKYGKYVGVIEDHATRLVTEECDCPACELQRKIILLVQGGESLAKRLEEMEKENRALREENREHRKAAGPQNAKDKERAAEVARLLHDLQQENDRLTKENIRMKARIMDLEAAALKPRNKKENLIPLDKQG